MKKYPAYKDSGIEWIGEIPEHWDIVKLKYLGEVILGLTYSPEDVVQDEKEGILVLRASNIQDGKLLLEDNVYVKKEIPNKLITKFGDILICSRSGSRNLIGKNICIDDNIKDCSFGAFMTIFRSDFWQYLSKVFNSMIFTSQAGLYLTSTINQLTTDTLNNLVITIPSLSREQQVIADFLDHKTSQIDTLIDKKKRQIELLKEQRQAVINQAVTKGLDPDVDMKDSGIEWLGKIPKHWGILPLKRVSHIKYGLGQPPKEKENGLPLIRATNIERGRIVPNDMIYVDPDDIPYDREPVLKENDIIVVRSGAYTGDSAIIPKEYEGAITGYDMVVSVYEADPQFISYGLLSHSILDNQINLCRLRAAQPHLNAEELGGILFFLPSKEEQSKIIAYLRGENNRIDNAITKAEKQIQLLQEYRTALISESVTGKIDVRKEN